MGKFCGMEMIPHSNCFLKNKQIRKLEHKIQAQPD